MVEKDRYSRYFLDLLLPGKIDLEIDGKQHKYADRVKLDTQRDNYLKSLGYKVYRIPFINPKNKEAVKEQVDLFLKWYNINK